ncbi:MarR family transcriptional regulator [Ameyamaea chiangmaiensis NBRC 103196]|uniref:Helix-turn-helix transcriptional regulator n=1 Tax=Ameyamaea chiangmaiensis TaxID=442969 RepID=A0A850PIV4_9PROT|nr:helix-turn-helix domain-containing protein [Ameyamaea chiangmaiensis]MBS4075229.1 helix-turn-helix transcriptional regulator [Ameyamaea chiangmaiensis]NVN41732.1 helix-turn-helix transcriptional regulator [Ameyamaea chiangmaiensis]GBQ66473.1 MarR family transcriptional regulator [Ameyamaea chiangmaiensis NBRC 103196]
MVTSRKPPSDAVPAAFNIYARECPARHVLDRLGNKWTLLVLDRLQRGRTRFNVLKRDIAGVSQKVLSQVLKNLERDGLVARVAYPTVPVTVEYSLTPLGETLTDAVSALTHWSEQHMPAIVDAHKAYDARSGQV